MSCNSLLSVANTVSQVITVGGTLNMGATVHKSGCSIRNDNGTVQLLKPGYFSVRINATASVTAEGSVTAQLYQDGQPVTAASATVTAAGAGDIVMLPIDFIVTKTGCICMPSTLSVVLTGGATVTNITATVEKIG